MREFIDWGRGWFATIAIYNNLHFIHMPARGEAQSKLLVEGN